MRKRLSSLQRSCQILARRAQVSPHHVATRTPSRVPWVTAAGASERVLRRREWYDHDVPTWWPPEIPRTSCSMLPIGRIVVPVSVTCPGNIGC
jgi:hypothetical protein